ncbi:MAG: SHD1 domain-containing protein, partial [Verrucomicrobiales bacterium]|nr:SHD1 domain-containing protein [Verrucomicrobiales bacterium]
MRSLLIFPVSVIWILLTGSLSPAIKAEPLNTERTWTDSTGRTVDAKLVGFQDKETLILQLQDGRQVPFPLARLSQPDQALAKSAFEKQKNSPENSNQNIDWESPKNSEAYVIRGLRRENPPGYVSTKSGWEYQIKCIEAKLQFKGNKKIADGNVTAYFYNRDDKLLE